MKADKIIEKELSYKICGVFFEVQNELGRFCREIQYADALAEKLKEKAIKFYREYPIAVAGRESNFVDFVIEDKILVDLKAKPFINKDDYNQMKRYLKNANFELGLIINFKDKYLKPKRILNGEQNNFVDSDKFAVLDRNNGFTLAELVISVGLFTILMSIAVGGFIQAMRNQRMIISLMAINDGMSLTMEQMAREIRTGYNFCTKNYPITTLSECNSLDNSEIQFVNAKNQVVRYRLSNSGIEKGIGEEIGGGFIYNKITADNVDVKNLNFRLSGNNANDNYPPRITVGVSFSSNSPDVKKLNISIDAQTTISARIIDT